MGRMRGMGMVIITTISAGGVLSIPFKKQEMSKNKNKKFIFNFFFKTC